MTETPAAEIVIIARDAAGTETDVTEAVKILYDNVHASMDWGSGFLGSDEVASIAAAADVCGFEALEDVATSYYSNDPKKTDLLNRAKDVRAAFKELPKIRPR